jgi:hypothetical protein
MGSPAGPIGLILEQYGELSQTPSLFEAPEVTVNVTTTMRALAATLITGTLLSACATGPTIRSDANPSVNVAAYQTFAFYSPLATDQAGYQTILTTRLKDATRRNLEAKGFRYSESEPELLVNFFVNVEDRQEIRATPAPPSPIGYYGYRSGFYGGWAGYYGGIGATEVQTINYQAGTLTIDLVDPAANALVWQGQAEGRVSSKARKNPGPAIDAAVAEIIATLPARAGP